MQIHELTKRRKETTNEGLLDTISNTINAVKTGYNAASKEFDTSQRVSAQSKINANAQAIAKKMAARGYNVDTSDPTATDAAGNMKVAGGTIQSVNPTLDTAIKQVQSSPQQKAEVQQLSGQATQTLQKEINLDDTKAVLPDPGTVFNVTLNKGNYYKDSTGQWYNELHNKVPAAHTKSLEQLVNNDQHTVSKEPDKTSPADLVTRRVKEPKTPKAATTPTEPTTNQAEPVKEAVTPGGLSRRAQQRNAPVAPQVSPTGKTPVAKPRQAKPKTSATQVAKPSVQQPAEDLESKLLAWTEQRVAGLTAAKSDPEVAQRLSNAFKNIMASRKNPQEVSKAYTDYMTIAKAAALYIQQKNERETTPSTSYKPRGRKGKLSRTAAKLAQDLDSQGSQGLAALARLDPPTNPSGSAALDELLRDVGALKEDAEFIKIKNKLAEELLAESQVIITKDIRVKTAKGDYVKRHSDQQWYDPNGVWIDPSKYSDYIKKLDNTPAAQTRYQADASHNRGSDTALAKAELAKAQADLERSRKKLDQEPVLTPAEQELSPEEQIALQQKRREREIRNHNAAVEKAVNDLRNAEIFKTGQAPYLQQELAALMAMKF